jgi:hypothetical protein
MYDHPGGRRLLLSQGPAWLGRLQARHLGSARRTSSRRLGGRGEEDVGVHGRSELPRFMHRLLPIY